MPTEKRNRVSKFRDAVRGMASACRVEKSFVIHLVAALLVILAGFVLRVKATEWCILILCIGGILTAETFNSAIESPARSVTSEHDENVGRSLDMAAGAVLLTVIGAACIEAIIFVPRLLKLLPVG